MEPVFLFNFFFPHSEQPHTGAVDAGTLDEGLFLRGLARAAQGFSSMRIDAVMLYGWEKSKKIKAPGTGFMRSIRIRYVPNPLLNATCPPCVLNGLWPWSRSQFEELLLDAPEVDAIAAPAGLLVETDFRM